MQPGQGLVGRRERGGAGWRRRAGIFQVMQRSVGDQQEIFRVHSVHYTTFCLRAVHSRTTDAALAVSIVHLRGDMRKYI